MSRYALILGALLALTASAKPPPAPASPTQAAKKKPVKGGRVIRLEELRVEGRIQKPEAFYLLQRSQLTFRELQRTESLLPKIDESVEKAPF